MMLLAFASCAKRRALPTYDAGDAAPIASAVADAAPDASESRIEAIQKLATMKEAIEFARPGMVTSILQDAGRAHGATIFAGWAAVKMRWSDVAVTKDETSYGLVLKDAAAALGKRICTPVRVDWIRALEHPSIGKIFMGGGRSLEGSYRLYAVGDTGALVDGSPARFCGVVSGISEADSLTNGKTLVDLVGMFDLPENRDAGAR